ncbi:type I-C CRISPR-associated protein Cas8c/Csd1 [candidate division TA06 bacterium B3_TA06]|uniref:Type I-C CRISPR-associated protein Cas8c/Csd1 n=1 Tax=candidate division TA06 bacterium B3_TA06 TaxID=2012487 RepID=A0A532V1E4_UNCT6|nr:MAG: type I-C CRISPR-associated protein Cas8c/Csd1 [candidate division TA06 bacterium B3_TA06]
MLEQLVKYAGPTKPGFAPKDVRWAIVCDKQSKFLGVLELGDASLKKNPGRTFSTCPELDQNVKQAGGKSDFLVDTAEIVALYGSKATDEKIKVKHDYFVKLLQNAGKVMPELRKLANLLDDSKAMLKIQTRLQDLKVKPNEKVTFKIGDAFPVESEAWHEWWQEFRKREVAKTSHGNVMRCFVTGNLVKPKEVHPKIKGLSDVGGRSSGDVLIGFDKDAFRSYGLQQSANAAVSEEAASAYRAALNDLIKNYGKRLAGAKVVHWFKEKVPEEDNPLTWLEQGAEAEELIAQDKARKLLDSIQSGKRPKLADNHYYALTLSGASGRVMVRDWMEGQFEELVGNVCAWFDDLSIVHRYGGTLAKSPKFLAVLGATVRELDDLPAPFVSKMWRVAVRGEPIPQFALAQTLARVKVDIIQDQPFNHARMGLMKAYHLRKKGNSGGDLKPYLNEEHPNPAYHCGRLMAVLARLQNAALGDVGAGVVQRYYAAASATPALVLGRLTRTSQFHLNKLDPGLSYWFEEKIAGIWGRIEDNLPTTLSLEEQSLFALGYYQQLADLRTKKSDKQRGG